MMMISGALGSTEGALRPGQKIFKKSIDFLFLCGIIKSSREKRKQEKGKIK